MSVGEAFDRPAQGRPSAREFWELRQEVRALRSERDELAEEAAGLRGQLIVAYQRLAANATGPDVAHRLLRLVCEEANRIRLNALRYAQRMESEHRSDTA
jgi:hypothetical protein